MMREKPMSNDMNNYLNRTIATTMMAFTLHKSIANCWWFFEQDAGNEFLWFICKRSENKNLKAKITAQLLHIVCVASNESFK